MKTLSDEEKTDLISQIIDFAMNNNVVSMAFICLKRLDDGDEDSLQGDLFSSNWLEVPYLLASAEYNYAKQ
jgi:hypothetical protein